MGMQRFSSISVCRFPSLLPREHPACPREQDSPSVRSKAMNKHAPAATACCLPSSCPFTAFSLSPLLGQRDVPQDETATAEYAYRDWPKSWTGELAEITGISRYHLTGSQCDHLCCGSGNKVFHLCITAPNAGFDHAEGSPDKALTSYCIANRLHANPVKTQVRALPSERP